MLVCFGRDAPNFQQLALTFTPTAYNKWHETELERWLSDHNVPYPTPADRKELEKLVQKNWNSYVVTPYKDWDADKLNEYLKLKGVETKDAAAASKDSLISQVQGVWYESEDKAQTAWSSVKDWILDTWTESQLKAFCDHHGIPGKLKLISLKSQSVLIQSSSPTPQARHTLGESSQCLRYSGAEGRRNRCLSRKLAVRDLDW